MEKIYFSPGTDCLNGIIDTLLEARHSVKICVFTISDNRIVDAIKELQYRGVNIKIISDNDKRFDRGSDIEYMASRGIAVHIDLTEAHMHHKFAVIDDKVTITGSYNWTRSAERFNHENIVITDSKTITKAFVKEFDKLWNKTEPLN